MAHMTRVDLSLSSFELDDALLWHISLYDKYIELLLHTISFQYCHTDRKQNVGWPSILNDKAAFFPDVTASKVKGAFILSLHMTRLEIDDRDRLVLGGPFFKSKKKYIGEPARHTKKFVGLFHQDGSDKVEQDARYIYGMHISDIILIKYPIPKDYVRIPEVIIPPDSFQEWLDLLRSAVNASISPFQPLLQTPMCHPELFKGVLSVPGYDDIKLDDMSFDEATKHLDKFYCLSRRSLFRQIEDESIRREVLENSEIVKMSGVNNVILPRGNGSNQKWSLIMTKTQACNITGYKKGKLREHLDKHPELCMQVGGYAFRFDCSDPFFGSLPIDEVYNQSLDTK